MSVSFETVENLLAVARDATTGRSFEERMTLLAGHVLRVIPHTQTMFTLIPLDEAHEEVRMAKVNAVRPEVMDEYARYYFKLDPSHDECRARLGQPFLLSEVVPHDLFGHDEYTSDCVLRGGFRHILGGWIPVARGMALQLTFGRPPGSEDFDAKELKLARLIAPDLARAAFGSLLAERLDALRRGDRGTTTGMIVFDTAGEVVQADGQALRLCKTIDPQRGVYADALVPPLRQLLTPGMERQPGASLEVVLRGVGGVWLLGTFTRVQTCVVCLLELLGPGSPRRLEAVWSSFHLTMREREIAELAVHQGLANKEIARRLGVAEITVKVHLSNAYRKAGVTSRAELAAAVLGSGGSNE